MEGFSPMKAEKHIDSAAPAASTTTKKADNNPVYAKPRGRYKAACELARLLGIDLRDG